jgi:hypothetical protein
MIASIASFVGLLEVAAYTASKSAGAGLTRALAVEWSPRGVLVNAIAPGVFRTDLNSALLDSPRGQELLQRTPMRRYGRLEELVGAAVYLASNASTFVTGQIITVDGGFLDREIERSPDHPIQRTMCWSSACETTWRRRSSRSPSVKRSRSTAIDWWSATRCRRGTRSRLPPSRRDRQ